MLCTSSSIVKVSTDLITISNEEVYYNTGLVIVGYSSFNINNGKKGIHRTNDMVHLGSDRKDLFHTGQYSSLSSQCWYTMKD